MELMLLRIFQRQVELQCHAVILAAQDLQRAMTVGAMPWVWVSIQNLLTAAANVSKALWGQGSGFAVQREALRDSLAVTDTSPLKAVSMRNHFEHYDERLDRWWATSANHNHLDMSIMPPSTVQGLADTDMFRVFDPTTSDLVFWAKGSTFSKSSLRHSVCCPSRVLKLLSLIGILPALRVAASSTRRRAAKACRSAQHDCFPTGFVTRRVGAQRGLEVPRALARS